MDGLNEGMGAGGWLLMSVFWIALVALVVWAVAMLSGRSQVGVTTGSSSGGYDVKRPEEILDRRLALGEIDPATYDALRAKLDASRPARM